MNSSSRMTSLAPFFRSSARFPVVTAGARLFPTHKRTLFQATGTGAGQNNTTEKPLLDEDWKGLMMVDYGTGATSYVPTTTSFEETRQAVEAAHLPIFQHWSSDLVREIEDPLL
jgi:hypothetical protein